MNDTESESDQKTQETNMPKSVEPEEKASTAKEQEKLDVESSRFGSELGSIFKGVGDLRRKVSGVWNSFGWFSF